MLSDSAVELRRSRERAFFVKIRNLRQNPITSYGLALPDRLSAGDQFDLALSLAGPLETGQEELLAGGIGYRFGIGESGVLGFVNANYARVTLGDDIGRALDAKGDRANATLGAMWIGQPDPLAKVQWRAEFQARHAGGEALGTEVVDEDLRILRVSLLFESGAPFGFRKRFALAVAKGLEGMGSTGNDNPSGSIPGSSADFLRVAGSAELSVPLSRRTVLNAGVIGQWGDVTMPFSQRCGYATNAYSRGFDVSYVNGDKCLGSRIELAVYVVLPDAATRTPTVIQGFAGVDGGRLWDIANTYTPDLIQDWSSLSAGVRVLHQNMIGEVALTRTLEAPGGTVEQQDVRLWLRGAMKF